MKKFTEEVKNSHTFELPITEREFWQYKDFINDLLRNFNSDNLVYIEGPDNKRVEVYAAYNYEKAQFPGREYSVLGKVNTNKLLIKKIWEKFEINDFNHLKNFIRKFCSDLFSENGRYFKSNPNPKGFSVWDTIRYTEILGEKNEDYVADFIKSLYGPESNPVREVTSSYKDMVLGIDITFKIDGQEKTCQVKPMQTANFKERGVVIIKSQSVVKGYDTDFISFVNMKRDYGQKILLFVNQGITYDGKNETFTIPYTNLVNKKL